VLGSRPSSATGRRGPSVANDDDLRVRSPIDEELLAVIRSLLLDRS
jgi:hypothetical protein